MQTQTINNYIACTKEAALDKISQKNKITDKPNKMSLQAKPMDKGPMDAQPGGMSDSPLKKNCSEAHPQIWSQKKQTSIYGVSNMGRADLWKSIGREKC